MGGNGMRGKVRIGALVTAAAAALVLTANQGGAGAASAQLASARVSPCSTVWGSTPKSSTDSQTRGTVTGLRAGRHECFDRLVIDGAGWADVRYVDRVLADGSGLPVNLRGGARLQIVTASAQRLDGTSGYRPRDPAELVDVVGWSTFRQLASAGDFEGQATIGLGVRARLPFRVFVLHQPGRAPRVVVDVAHRW